MLTAMADTVYLFPRVDVETVAAINLFVGTDIKYDEKEESS